VGSASGEPLHAAIVWQDRRTAARCEQLRADGREPLVRERTGLVLDPYFSATKIEWLLEHVDGLRERAEDGRAGVRDGGLVADLQADRRARDRRDERVAHDAVRHRRRAVGPGAARPVRRSRACIAARAAECRLVRRHAPDALHGHAIALSGVAGDQQAALFGHACVEPATGKNTYGTGSFVLVNAGFVTPRPPPGLLVTAACTVGEERAYALEASIFVTGAAVQWLRDGLQIIERAEETEQLARALDDNGGCTSCRR